MFIHHRAKVVLSGSYSGIILISRPHIYQIQLHAEIGEWVVRADTGGTEAEGGAACIHLSSPICEGRGECVHMAV